MPIDDEIPGTQLAEIKAMLSGLREHNTLRAIRGYCILSMFWARCRENNFVNRVAVADRLVAEIKRKYPEVPVSRSSIWRMESAYQRRGVIGLAGLTGRSMVRRSGLSLGTVEGYETRLRTIVEQAQALLSELASLKDTSNAPGPAAVAAHNTQQEHGGK